MIETTHIQNFKARPYFWLCNVKKAGKGNDITF